MFDTPPLLDPARRPAARQTNDPARCPDHPPLQQSPAFVRALAEVGQSPGRLVDDTVILHRHIGPLTLRMITRPAARSTADMLKTMQQMPGRGPLIISPEVPMPLHRLGAVPLVSPNTVAQLDLTPGPEALMAGLHPKWRNRLRHAQGQKLRITRQNMPDDLSHWLLLADRALQRQRRYHSWPPHLTLAYGRANPGQAKLFTAFMGRTPVAGIVILRHGAGATYHIGHSGPLGRLVSAHTLLIWSAMLWARAKGITTLELGTLDTEGGAGLARFKLGTGATVRTLGGTWGWWPPLTSLCRPVARLDRRLMGCG